MRIFNDFAIGGYLINAIPDEPVFIDGRIDLYSGETLNDYFYNHACSNPT